MSAPAAGTTAISALALNRLFIGDDNDQGRINATLNRIALRSAEIAVGASGAPIDMINAGPQSASERPEVAPAPAEPEEEHCVAHGSVCSGIRRSIRRDHRPGLSHCAVGGAIGSTRKPKHDAH